jgi:hypothetical protein
MLGRMAFDSPVPQPSFPSVCKVEAVAAMTATEEVEARGAANTRAYADLAEITGLKTFATRFAGHIAAEAGRS